MSLEALLEQIKACQLCTHGEGALPLGANPVVKASSAAKILIIGQAPGTKVHASGIPWNDASGERLRDWLGLNDQQFYDQTKVAIMPMGFCYPGRFERGGDLPPRPECAPTWHDKLLALMPNIELRLLIGAYAQARYLPETKTMSLTGRVAQWRDFAPKTWVLPHPSWRNTAWIKKNPWFETELLPALKPRVQALVA